MRLNMELWLEEVEEVACQHCSCFNYKELNSPTRKFTYDDRSYTYCDNRVERRDWQGTGWYRITGEAGTKLVDSPAPAYYCGTHMAGWLFGGHPTVSMGEVERTVNFNWKDNVAYSNKRGVKVVNCSTHYVYYLINTVCHYGYCTE